MLDQQLAGPARRLDAGWVAVTYAPIRSSSRQQFPQVRSGGLLGLGAPRPGVG
jgi:hypothetical protein